MPTPSLRILLADDQPEQRLNIEKMLNQQGYYRIAPVACFKELLGIVYSAMEPFDLLMINRAMAANEPFRVNDFFFNAPMIRHTLVYEGAPLGSDVIILAPGSRVIKTLAGPPDHQGLKDFMQMIDPSK